MDDIDTEALDIAVRRFPAMLQPIRSWEKDRIILDMPGFEHVSPHPKRIREKMPAIIAEYHRVLDEREKARAQQHERERVWLRSSRGTRSAR